MRPLIDKLEAPQIDAGLLFLRVTGAFMLFYVHGLPKIVDFNDELTRIEDPFGLGQGFSLLVAIIAEVLCPVLIAAGVFTRFACLPVLAVLLVAMLFVHPHWTIAQGQFGWLLLIIFSAVTLCGPGKWALMRPGRS